MSILAPFVTVSSVCLTYIEAISFEFSQNKMVNVGECYLLANIDKKMDINFLTSDNINIQRYKKFKVESIKIRL